MAAPQITQVALHRLCDYEGAAPEEVFGCVCDGGADCNTDHRLVRAKLVVGKSVRSFKRTHGGTWMKRWDVAKLQGACVDEMGRVTARARFLGGIGEKLRERWDKDSNVEGKWDVLRSVMCDAAKECLEHEDRRQPD